ncbi:MAG TPA: helix-turn-helix transcriptional regulator [Burkholderiaceae bacterium]
MVSASLLVQARRNAGLSQRALAERAGVAQQEIARYERGRVTPSFERLRSLIAACGLELTVGLARADDSYDEQITAALALTPPQRLERALRDAQPLRAARAQAAGTPAPSPVDVLGALEQASVQYVLIGELAEVVHGSPLLPTTGTVTIVPRAGQRERLTAVIATGGGQPIGSSATPAIDAPSSFALGSHATELVIEPAPRGTQGYDDLRRDATEARLGEELVVPVASLVDLVRIAEATSDGRARVPALRRTLDLATAAPATRAA